jgi:lycopene beta-cyclase
MKHESADIVTLGGGMASLSLIVALLLRGYRGRIIILEQLVTPNADKTWCFWGKGSVPRYLQPLIRQQWPQWSASHNGHEVSQSSRNGKNDYCCILAEDFYHFAFTLVEQNDNVSFFAGQSVIDAQEQAGEVRVRSRDYDIVAQHCLDTRYQPDSSEQGFYQCFAGLWLEADQALFDPSKVELMHNLECHGGTLQFDYVLPLSSHQALFERTFFSPQPLLVEDLTRETEQAIISRYGNIDINVQRREQGILPMIVTAPPVDTGCWHYAGTAGGHMRSATGYAFVSVQRWAQVVAVNLVDHQVWPDYQPIKNRYRWMDKIFLRVLAKKMDITPALFMRLLEQTESDQFARFMTERASYRDLFAIIKAMPKRPFLNALY